MYITYTVSALLFAKPFLKSFGSKTTVLIGLIGLLIYVSSFFLAILFLNSAAPIFITGACLGGIHVKNCQQCVLIMLLLGLGAGLLWTGQGSYYSLNSQEYSKVLSSSDNNTTTLSQVLTSFASIFATVYLGLETVMKVLATVVYLAFKKSNEMWKPTVFGIYTVSAFFAVLGFWKTVIPLYSKDSDRVLVAVTQSQLSVSYSVQDRPSDYDENYEKYLSDHSDIVNVPSNPFREMLRDLFAVTKAIFTERKLQLMLPYQICFGLSAGLIDYYVCGFIVKEYIGDGYIGVLSALTTSTAAVLSYPFAMLSNRYIHGKWTVMILSCFCFFFAGAPLLVFSDHWLGNWFFMVIYFVIHGAARGAWESINKAVIAEYFPTEQTRDVAFAAIYFSSGIAGAFGYFGYQHLTRLELAWLNTIVSIIGMICYHLSTTLPV